MTDRKSSFEAVVPLFDALRDGFDTVIDEIVDTYIRDMHALRTSPVTLVPPPPVVLDWEI